MDMHFGKTQRGFPTIAFKDRYDVDCGIQMSSLATESAIWFGCDKPDAKILIDGQGWTAFDLPEDVMTNTRMHLNDAQVMDLLPVLVCFACTGELPTAENLNLYQDATSKLVNALGSV